MMACGATQTTPTPTERDAGTDAGPPDSGPPDVGPVDAVPPPFVSPAPVASVALGAESSCALDASGVVRCWGSHRFGQLGDPSLEMGYSSDRARPDVVAGIVASRITSGTFHVCVITGESEDEAAPAPGSVQCWGHDGWGQLGDGGRDDRPAPVTVAGLDRVIAMAAGEGHTCALRDDHSVWCWGRNHMGQLGDGANADRPTPTQVPELRAEQLAAGRAHTCAIDEERHLWCWGEDLDGQLASGGRSEPLGYRPCAERVEGLADVRAMGLGGGHTCVVRDEGVFCWGRNDSQQLGVRPSGRQTTIISAPTLLPGSEGAVEVRGGSRFTCVRFPFGGVRCVGLGHFGQLGDRQRRGRRSLVEVDDLADATSIDLGAEHACATQPEGVVCWGADRRGELGDGAHRARGSDRTVRALIP